jgi:aerobic carbon-monoxide dehydrogenase large subunit
LPAHPTGAAVCEVEIDPDTGTVALTRYTSVDDCGQPINPLICTGRCTAALSRAQDRH